MSIPTQEEIAQQQELLMIHRRTLSEYLIQQAKHGTGFTPPAVAHGIRETRGNIRRVKDILRDWGVDITNHPDDEQSDDINLSEPHPHRSTVKEQEDEQPGHMNVQREHIPPEPAPSQSVSRGFMALAELMRAPDVRAAVITFEAVFLGACEQIDVLGDYKDLHDLLHTLQFQCYSCIVREARRFPGDEVTRDDLADYELTLQGIVDRMRDVTSRPSFANNPPGWINDLSQARKEMHEAIQETDVQQLKRVVWRIKRVLDVQPTLINTRLSEATRVLRLPALEKAMAFILGRMVRSDLDSEKVRQFEIGVNALESLSQSLVSLINEHDKWQAVDLELRRIEALLEQDITELEISWPSLKQMTEPLYSVSTDTWAESLKIDGEYLEQAIGVQAFSKIREHFRRYRRQADDRFYRIDVDLKRLCGDLRKVGEPLASVLRMIE